MMLLVINESLGLAAQKKGHATIPEDFTHLDPSRKDFVAWREGRSDPRWHIETTLDGPALVERIRRELTPLTKAEATAYNAKSASIARRMATQWWGEVQNQRKLAPGIWMFDTAGHGGIVVDTFLRPELEMCNSQVTYRQNWAIPGEQHFAAFEEDCMAAFVEYLYCREIHTEAFRKHYVGSDTVPPEVWFENRRKLLKEHVERYNYLFINDSKYDFLARYPEPGMGQIPSKLTEY